MGPSSSIDLINWWKSMLKLFNKEQNNGQSNVEYSEEEKLLLNVKIRMILTFYFQKKKKKTTWKAQKLFQSV